MKDLSHKTGTIAAYLTKNQNKIYGCGNNINKMKSVVLELLSAEEIQGNPETANAINILSKLHGNHFLSTLVTYMTGYKVGR